VTSPTPKARPINQDVTAWWAALLAPVLLVNAVAFSGQYAWANANLPRWDVLVGDGWGFNLTAAAFAAALESIAIYLQYEAHTALMAGDASLKLRLGSYAVALLAGVLNYWHWANPDHSPTPAAVAFGALSAISPWLWAVRSRSMHREQLREQGLVEQRAVKFATARWLLYPRRTYSAFRLAVWEGETDPRAAIALLEQPAVADVALGPAPVLAREVEVEVETATDVAPTPVPVKPAAKPPAKGPKAAPSREQARAILMALPDFEAVSNAELARLHGGTDTFWRGRKVDLRTELAELTTEAGAL
jgi:hypothetical protein